MDGAALPEGALGTFWGRNDVNEALSPWRALNTLKAQFGNGCTLTVCTVVCQSLRPWPGHGDLQVQTQLMAQGFDDLPLLG